jgi:hypothetical protein
LDKKAIGLNSLPKKPKAARVAWATVIFVLSIPKIFSGTKMGSAVGQRWMVVARPRRLRLPSRRSTQQIAEGMHSHWMRVME